MTHDPERDNALAAAAGALRHLTRLSGWVTHEVNNPLGGIQNAFALVREAVPPDHPHFKYVAAIEREIARITTVTRRLQHTYSSDGERAAPLPIARFIAAALEPLEPLCQARRVGVEVNIEPPAASEEMAGDVAGRMIRHLAQYGIESAEPDSVVVLRVGRAGDRIHFAVPGHPPDDHARRAAVAGPPGLALELVTMLVGALGGEIMAIAGQHGASETRVGIPTLRAAKEAE